MKIEEGKSYRDRLGRKWSNAREIQMSTYHLWLLSGYDAEEPYDMVYDYDGKWLSGADHDYDLVAECKDDKLVGPELLSCPFCGGEADMNTRSLYQSTGTKISEDITVYCTTCSALIQEDPWEMRVKPVDSINYITASWNRRVTDPRVAKLNAENIRLRQSVGELTEKINSHYKITSLLYHRLMAYVESRSPKDTPADGFQRVLETMKLLYYFVSRDAQDKVTLPTKDV